MKKFLARVFAVVAFSAVSAISVQTASAGGKVYEPPVSQTANWKGFYLGAHLGLADAESDISFFGINAIGFDDDSFAGGIHFGYNWQRGNVVYGIEADYTFTGIDYQVFGTDVANIDGLGSVRARLGYAVKDLLLFATAGVAWKDTDTLFSLDLDDTGYVYGAGAELKLGSNYSLRTEVLQYSFENESVLGAGVVDVDTDITVVRTGLSVHF